MPSEEPELPFLRNDTALPIQKIRLISPLRDILHECGTHEYSIDYQALSVYRSGEIKVENKSLYGKSPYTVEGLKTYVDPGAAVYIINMTRWVMAQTSDEITDVLAPLWNLQIVFTEGIRNCHGCMNQEPTVRNVHLSELIRDTLRKEMEKRANTIFDPDKLVLFDGGPKEQKDSKNPK